MSRPLPKLWGLRHLQRTPHHTPGQAPARDWPRLGVKGPRFSVMRAVLKGFFSSRVPMGSAEVVFGSKSQLDLHSPLQPPFLPQTLLMRVLSHKPPALNSIVSESLLGNPPGTGICRDSSQHLVLKLQREVTERPKVPLVWGMGPQFSQAWPGCSGACPDSLLFGTIRNC